MIRPTLVLAACLVFCLTTHGQYAGRYTDGRDYAVYFEETPHGLTIRPVLWTATQILEANGKDKFVVVDRTSRGAQFSRNPAGQIVGVKVIGMDGEGLELRREPLKTLPIELLIDGRAREAANAYVARGDTKKAIEVAEQVLFRMPSRTHAVEVFLRTLAPAFSSDAPFLTPVPHRGKVNEPAFVRHVAEYHAKRRGVELEHLARVTSANATTLFLCKIATLINTNQF